MISQICGRPSAKGVVEPPVLDSCEARYLLEECGVRILGHVPARLPQDVVLIEVEILDDPIPRAHQVASDDRLADHESAVLTKDTGGIGRIAPLDDQQILRCIRPAGDDRGNGLADLLSAVEEISQVSGVLAAQENGKVDRRR